MITGGTEGLGIAGSFPWRSRAIPGCLLLVILSLTPALQAANRITLAIDDNRRAALPGHVSPRIASGVDQGPVDPSMELAYVTLVLKLSPSQQAGLDRLLAEQQDPSSPNYHRWLTPEQYADRFGVSQADIGKMVAWLGQQHLTVKSVARARNAIAFGGAAGEIGRAFRIGIRRYQVGGELHYANAADPTIPVAFQSVVRAIHGLHDFRLKPKLRPAAHPRDTLPNGEHQIAPDDVAIIYGITPLYNAGIDGTGQTLVVVGQTNIQLSDIEQFRSSFNLPANDPAMKLVPGNKDPGIVPDELLEADLDLELAGAVARRAAISFVYAPYVEDALQYAIDQNVAPVISISYGACEQQTDRSTAQDLEQSVAQANAQGITVFAASGDLGAADCLGGSPDSTALAVDLPAALPEVTGVGGTEFNEGGGSYWNLKNTDNHASALSYIPETAWNDSASDNTPAASGGGASIYFTKPSWQKGTGVPNDGARDIPDVSLAGSADHDGYGIFSGGGFQTVGGTSAGPPVFAGIAVLLSQYQVANGFQSNPGLGNINPVLYALALVGGVYHDITSGSNKVFPCIEQSRCTLPAIGYNAGVGYDRVTGLGSVNVYNLVTSWHTSVVGKASPSMLLSPSASNLAFTDTTTLTATVTGSGPAPTGTVTFSVGNVSLGAATLAVSSNGTAAAKLRVEGIQLAAGVNSVTAEYGGDTNYFGATDSVNVTITSTTNGTPTLNADGLLNAASFTQALAPGGVLSIFGSQLAPATGTAPFTPLPTMLAGTIVTINGIAAPLYYVSPAQLNVQIPYEIPANSSATLLVNNNGRAVFSHFDVSAAAPAIFAMNSQGTGQGAVLNNVSYQLVDASHPATPGSTYIQIYCMGLGAVSHQPASGAASPLSPLAETSVHPQVTIGGVTAFVAFSGLAPGFVGEYQVNAQVPADLPTNPAVPVVISINGVASNTVTIAIRSE